MASPYNGVFGKSAEQTREDAQNFLRQSRSSLKSSS